MKKLFYSLIVFSTIAAGLSSCSNGDYTANPDTNANGSINPLNPLKPSDFSWGGDDPLSANLNGTKWVAETVALSYDSSVGNAIVGMRDGKIMIFYLQNVWRDNVYDMGFAKYDRYAVVKDSATASDSSIYVSYIGNSGGLYMTQNDSAIFAGKFYFQGVNKYGKILNVTNGHFKIAKPI